MIALEKKKLAQKIDDGSDMSDSDNTDSEGET